MKKNLFLGFLILFAISTSAFAGTSDPKNESSANTNKRENKLSDEEVSRLNLHANTDNLSKTNLVNKESNDSKKDLAISKQVYVEGRHHHHGGYVIYGGGSLLLIIILVLILA